MCAASEGHYACVELLLRRGADASVKEWLGQTARDLAEQNGHVGIVEMFSVRSSLTVGMHTPFSKVSVLLE